MAAHYLRQRAYRLSHPEQRDRERRMNAARQRALVALRRQYPDDFRRLYLTELEAAGITGAAA
jgi:hypothetical protein